MQTKTLVRNAVAAVSIVVVATVLIGAVAWNPARETPIAAPVAVSAQTPMLGVATGEMQNGVAIYRLPSVAVTVTRSEALAQIAREEQVAQKQPGRPAL